MICISGGVNDQYRQGLTLRLGGRGYGWLTYDPTEEIQIRRFRLEVDDIDELTELVHRAYRQLANMGLNYTAVDQDAIVTRRPHRRGEWHCGGDRNLLRCENVLRLVCS